VDGILLLKYVQISIKGIHVNIIRTVIICMNELNSDNGDNWAVTV